MKEKCLRCGYEWEYKGASTWYASCPNCRTTVKLKNVDKGVKKE